MREGIWKAEVRLFQSTNRLACALFAQFQLGSEEGVFWKRGLFRKAHFLENLEILEKPPDLGKQRRIRPFSRYCREFRDFRDSRHSSNEKTPLVFFRSRFRNGKVA